MRMNSTVATVPASGVGAANALVIVVILAAGLYFDVLTDIAGQTALSAAVWLALFYVRRGATREERRALMGLPGDRYFGGNGPLAWTGLVFLPPG